MVLPRWLARKRSRQVGLPQSLRQGVSVLLGIARLRGVRIPAAGEKISLDRCTKLNDRVYGLPARAGLILNGRCVWEGELRNALTTALMAAVGDAARRQWSLKDVQHLVAANRGAAREAAVSAFHELERRLRLQHEPVGPHDLARLGHSLLSANAGKVGILASDVHAVCAIGLAADCLRDMRSCVLCYRWALPGEMLCSHHGLSKSLDGPARARQRIYAEGRRTAKHPTWRLRTCQRGIRRMDPERVLPSLATCLHGPLVRQEERLVDEVVSAICRHPHVLEVVGRGRLDLRPRSALFEELRTLLDPLEFDPRAWPDRIHLAEVWFRARFDLIYHYRGAGTLRHTRLLEAAYLARLGYTKSKISAELNVHLSTVSHWLRRDFGEPLRRALLRSQ